MMDKNEIIKVLEFYADKDRWSDFEQDVVARAYDRNVGSELGGDMGDLAQSLLDQLRATGMSEGQPS